MPARRGRSTFAERLRFALLMQGAALGLTLRDAVLRWGRSQSYDARVRRASAEEDATLCRTVRIPFRARWLEGRLAMPAAAQPKALVLLLHGIGERLFFWTRVQRQLAEAGYGSLVFHYPSYGRSGGVATPEGFEASAVAAYGFLQAQAPELPMFLMGTSMGTAVAAQVAAMLRPEPEGVVLAQGFPSLREAARAVGVRLGLPPGAVARAMPDLWRSAERLSALRCPVLVVHSEADELFPLRLGRELFAAAEQRAQGRQSFRSPVGFGHGDVCLRPEPGYWEPIVAFLEEVRTGERAT